MASNNSSQQRLLAIAAVVVVALLAINAFLLYNKVSQGKVIDQQQAELDEAGRLKIELEKQYHEALSELEEMRGANEELNAIIDQQKIELKQQRDKVAQLIQDGKQLNRARAELNNMKGQVEQYLAQINELKAENESLREEREQLTERSQKLAENLDSARMKNQALSSDYQSLSSEKQQLSEERNRLADKVNLASVIKIPSIEVTPLKERNSGKTVKKKYAKNVDQLKICFKTSENKIAKAGVEQFHVRIITPVGETMAVEGLGSGKIYSRDSGEEVLYSFVKEYDYANDEAQICHNWDPNLGAFGKGKYVIEVYNKGHLAGTSDFILK